MRLVGHEQLRKEQSREFKHLPFVLTRWDKPQALVVPFDREVAKIIEKYLNVKRLEQRVRHAKNKGRLDKNIEL